MDFTFNIFLQLFISNVQVVTNMSSGVTSNSKYTTYGSLRIGGQNMLNELMKAKVNRLRLSVRSYINPTEQNKPLELKPWASDVTRDPCKP